MRKGQLIWIGVAALSELHEMPDFKRNDHYDLLSDGDTIRISTFDLFETHAEAAIHQYEMIKIFKPMGNIWGRTIEPIGAKGKSYRVEDIDSGEQYANAAILAKHIGKTPSAISKHLSGEIDRLNGRRYRRI